MEFILGFFILLIISSAIHDSNKKRNSKKFTKALTKHINTLSRKKDLYSTKDDYGFIDNKLWELEKVNFINKLIFHKEIGEIDEKSKKKISITDRY